MPIYDYLCERGHRFDALQRMSDEPLRACEVCGAPVQRVMHPVAIHFKGSGFYTTDYGRAKAAKRDEGKESGGSDGAKPAESAKPASGSATGSGSSGTGSSGTGSSGTGSGAGSSSSSE